MIGWEKTGHGYSSLNFDQLTTDCHESLTNGHVSAEWELVTQLKMVIVRLLDKDR